jgi:glutaredoxin
MAIRLHRCPNKLINIDAHPCARVQKALDEQGIEYELVVGPWLRGNREEVKRLSGQERYPTIEFEDGRVYRAESKDMASKIRAGELFS